MPRRSSRPRRPHSPAKSVQQECPPVACPGNPSFAVRPIALAAHLMAAAGVLATAGFAPRAHAQASPGAEAAETRPATRHYDIPAGSLPEVLTRFSAQAGIYLAGSTELAQGKTSAGVSGDYSVDSALTVLLEGTGLQVVRLGNGGYGLRAKPGATATGSATDAALPPVTITSTSDAEVARLNPPTTVGSKIPLTQREIPQSVNVITHDQIRQQGVTSLNEVMTYVPGVQALYTTADRLQYYSRGFPLNNYQIDGLPVFTNSNVSSTSNTQTPNLAMYDRVEVLTGPAGLLSGMGDAGGVINLVRKHAPSRFMASGQVTMGNHHHRMTEIDVGGPLNESGTIRGLIVGSYQDQNLQQDTTWKRNKLVYATLDIDITSSTLIRAGGSYSDQALHSEWGNGPIKLSNGKFYVPPRSRYFGADWNRDTASVSDIFAELQHKFDNGWVLRAAADYQVNKYTYVNSYIRNVDADTFSGTLVALNSLSWEHNQNFEISASGPLRIWGKSANLTVGANYMKMNNWTKSYYDQPYPDDYPFAIPVSSIFNVNVPRPIWTGQTNNTGAGNEYGEQYGAYANARINVSDPLTLIVGGRVSWYSDKFVPDSIYNADQLTSQFYSDYDARVTPYFGAVYDINEKYSAYASYTSIFTPQFGAMDSNRHGLAPVIGSQFEIGIKGEHFNGLLNTSAAIYQITQKNTAIADPLLPNSGYSVAQGKVRNRGFEIKAHGRLGPGWDISGGYTYNDAEYLEGTALSPASSPFAQTTPRSQLTLWTNYRLPEPLAKLQIGGGIVATTSTRSGSGYRQGSYYVANTLIAYQISKKTSLSLNINNLFDKDYYQNAQFRGFPRQALLTLRAAY
ncbi:MAG: TonB-dependent siderophore receptor [Burkholderiaceae bacterium]